MDFQTGTFSPRPIRAAPESKDQNSQDEASAASFLPLGPGDWDMLQ